MIKGILPVCRASSNLKFLTVIVGLMVATSGHSKMQSFETTRLKSTGGAGVASLLMDESTILNPAPLAFFNMSSIYFQKSGSDFTGPEGQDLDPSGSNQTAFIASDSSGNLNGSVSYIKYNENDIQRKRWGFSFATPLGKKSSSGVTYRMTTDKDSNGEESYKQLVFGFSHILSENLSMGIVFEDPFKAHEGDTRAILGFQYVYKDMVSFMLDGSADYNKDLNETAALKSALQVKVYNDFYIRFGMFDDKGNSTKGNGAGLGWVQPKLEINLALKNINKLENVEIQQNNEKIKETSFSLSYRF